MRGSSTNSTPAEEAEFVRAAQEAAEAACVEVIGRLAASEPQRDGSLWLEGSPLTSERLMARAQAALNEIGYGASELIVAGSPECALPHFRRAARHLARGVGPPGRHRRKASLGSERGFANRRRRGSASRS